MYQPQGRLFRQLEVRGRDVPPIIRRVTRGVRFSILPAVGALAAFFMVLPQTGGDATVEMVRARGSWRFDPQEIRVDLGERIAFVNDSSVTHTATCTSCAGDAWDTGDVQPGQTKLLAFEETKSYLFACRYHGQVQGMTGQLTVGDAPPPPSPSPSTPGIPGF